MPIGDEKHKLIYGELVNILGEDYVEDDPAIMEAFSRESQAMLGSTRGRCEFIVLPGSTEDVQNIYRLANRLGFPCSVTSTGLFLAVCCAVEGHTHWCLIDPKRMNHFYVDDRNMHAVVEPYVSVAQVQAETMKYGLFTGCTGAGAQGSALATSLNSNSHWTGWRTGKGRNLLGLEWVLPTGDILRTGSLAIPRGGFCWGEGPGVDALGLMRGNRGPMGALGMVTLAAIKLHPWPGPAVWPAEGIQPHKTSRLPPDLFRTFLISYPTLESCVEAIRELGEAEIGGVVMQGNPYEIVALGTTSREEFWKKWQSPFWQSEIHGSHEIFVTLWGYAGPSQVTHEEGVLREIVADTGGKFLPDEEITFVRDLITSVAVRDSFRTRYLRLGVNAGIEGASDSLYDTLRSIPRANLTARKFSPPLGDGGLYDRGENQHKFWISDFGRVATIGIGVFGERSEECEEFLEKNVRPYTSKQNAAEGIFSVANATDASKSGARFAGIHLLLASIKKTLDPNNIANPTRLVDMDRMRGLPFGKDAAPAFIPPKANYSDDLAAIVGAEHMSTDHEVLSGYAGDYSFVRPCYPRVVVFPGKTEEVQEVVRYASARRIAITPRSSPVSFHGAGIPTQSGILMDLRRMNQILEIDPNDRKVKVEPGVTWQQAQTELAKHGLMVCSPLLPHRDKSVLTSTMQREPMLIPKSEYNENLLTAEMVIGNGELFWTGTALSKGMVGRSNPEAFILGTRLFRGHQGALGIFTWANIKAELIPSMDKLYFIPCSRIEDVAPPVYRLQRLMLGSECFVLNRFNLASILSQTGLGGFDELIRALPEYTILICLSGPRRRPQGCIKYQEEALMKVSSELGFKPQTTVAGLDLNQMIPGLLRKPWPHDRYWKQAPNGGFCEVFFHATLDRAPEFVGTVAEITARHGYPPDQFGIYLQPVERARICFYQFTFNYAPHKRESARAVFVEASRRVVDMGGLFTTPYGTWADLVFSRTTTYNRLMRAVKDAFDPNDILNPGKLCF